MELLYCPDRSPDGPDDLYAAVTALNSDVDNVDLVWHDWRHKDWETKNATVGDLAKLGVVMALVYVTLLVQTQSGFLASMGFFAIILSFPLGYFPYVLPPAWLAWLGTSPSVDLPPTPDA